VSNQDFKAFIDAGNKRQLWPSAEVAVPLVNAFLDETLGAVARK
jgi:hypothetical protein